MKLLKNDSKKTSGNGVMGEEETTMTVGYWHFWCQAATEEAPLFLQCASKERVTQTWIYLYPVLALPTTNHTKHTLTCTSMSGTAQIMGIIFINFSLSFYNSFFWKTWGALFIILSLVVSSGMSHLKCWRKNSCKGRSWYNEGLTIHQKLIYVLGLLSDSVGMEDRLRAHRQMLLG